MLYENLPYEKVWSGNYVVYDNLLGEIDNIKSNRVLIVTTNSVTSTTSYKKLLDSFKDYPTFIMKSKQHVPVETLLKNINEIKSFSPDVIISIGGGSSIDTAKILSFMLVYSISTKEELIEYSIKGKRTKSLYEPLLPHFTIPTTLSSAEFSCVAGFSDQTTGKKYGLFNKYLTPSQIFLDPIFSVETPVDFWISTGIRGIDHAVETLYSPVSSPVTQTLSLESLKYLFRYLPLSKENPESLEYRLKCQLGSWLSLFSSINIKTGLSHIIGHQLGAAYDIPHGLTSAIILPNVMEFMYVHTIEQQASIYSVLYEAGITNSQKVSVKEKALEAPILVRELVNKLNLPHRLRDFNVTKESFPFVVENIISEVEIK
ncbi:iron-containing alcohol dehydrogenase [Bacillus dakarensis]|uniref:iron-containing alcohol dehydrogenase n=1 Tax=Robertmurraya dakarensis TaxID=1926278 RepID=UPI000981A461|nr:iron-containing alcohol dehydrogenase [Bacillus dakarensis]